MRAMPRDEYDNAKLRSSPPWKLEFRSSRKFVISVVSMAIFTDVFIYGMVVPILPTVLKTRVSVPDDELQRWMSILLAAFGGALFVGSPTLGYYADRSASRRGPFLIGLLALAGTTVMFWVGTTVTALVVARLLQGLSAAVVWTVGMALVVDTVGKDQVGSAMGYVSMSMTLGTVFGPFVGGAVLSQLGYHAVFVIAMGLIALDIVLRLFMIEQKTARKWMQPAASGGETEGLLNADTAPLYQTTDHSPPEVPDVPVASPSGDLEPVSHGGTSSVPPIVRLMCSGSMVVALAATVMVAMIWSSFDTVLPLYVMKTFQWGPFFIGISFLPLFLPSFFSPQIGDAVDRWGPRPIAFLGFLLDCPIFFLLQLVSQNTTQGKVLLFVFLFVAGVATALQMVGILTEVSHGVERVEKERPGIFGQQGGVAQAYGLFNVAWSGGQVLGPLAAGLLMDLGGWTVLVSVFGALSGGTALMVLYSDPSILRQFRRRPHGLSPSTG